ncbi:MAG: nucleotidyl transferase AbiEii/AbiGii toxin family protein [Lentimicrobiaceae bacterium]|nr:nucleotidyl transferase AbiEii/AbiGii toxin family protein [Lentimicrobiaceae bacterium]
MISEVYVLELGMLKRYAENRGMPVNKMRGVVREYIQVIILKALANSEFGKGMVFTGGTSLRLIEGSRRFSEDLDFYSKNTERDTYEHLLQSIISNLSLQNISADYELEVRENIFCGNLIFDKIESQYRTSMRKSKGLIIKIESAKPEWTIEKEQKTINGYGEVFVIDAMKKSILLADKIDAIHKKPRGRHIFDIVFLLSLRVVPDVNILKLYGYSKDWKTVLINKMEQFTDKELKEFGDRFAPFLFDEQDKNIIVNSKAIVRGLIDK